MHAAALSRTAACVCHPLRGSALASWSINSGTRRCLQEESEQGDDDDDAAHVAAALLLLLQSEMDALSLLVQRLQAIGAPHLLPTHLLLAEQLLPAATLQATSLEQQLAAAGPLPGAEQLQLQLLQARQQLQELEAQLQTERRLRSQRAAACLNVSAMRLEEVDLQLELLRILRPDLQILQPGQQQVGSRLGEACMDRPAAVYMAGMLCLARL